MTKMPKRMLPVFFRLAAFLTLISAGQTQAGESTNMIIKHIKIGNGSVNPALADKVLFRAGNGSVERNYYIEANDNNAKHLIALLLTAQTSGTLVNIKHIDNEIRLTDHYKIEEIQTAN